MNVKKIIIIIMGCTTSNEISKFITIETINR